MERSKRLALIALIAVVLIPGWAYAQAEITGVVRDSSGGVLPGVTVDAASPALIERVRTAVTDGTGRYRIIDLRPGTYTVTFTLPGFTTVVQERIAVSGTGAIAVNAELGVGALQETVTVSGETPTVDVQTVTRQQVLDSEVINAIPQGRNYDSLAQLLPGVNVTATTARNVGNVMGPETACGTNFHGSRGSDTRVTLNGVSTMTLQAGGSCGGPVPDVGSAVETTLDHTGASAELPTGGLRINFIPRDGGNTWSNSTFFTFTNEDLQGDNFTQRLRTAGLRAPDKHKKSWDVNPAFGGPIARDRLWFWFSARYTGVENYAAIFENKNAWDPTKWTYEPDESRQGVNHGRFWSGHTRVTWQATSRIKIAGTYKPEKWCRCPTEMGATVAPEAANDRRFPRLRQEHLELTFPATNRVLFEAVGMHLYERWGRMHFHPKDSYGSLEDPVAIANLPLMISVQEQTTGLTFRQRAQMNNTRVPNYSYRAAVSYVTGAHAFKAGFNNTHGYLDQYIYTGSALPVSYRFANGVPNQITQRATPYQTLTEENADLGFFAQDRWTLGRLSLNGALRYDYFKTSAPQQTLGPAPLVPGRNVTFPQTDMLGWHDLTYRSGAAYDVFGDGRTAIKATVNRYLLGQTLNGIGSAPAPVNTLVNQTTRAWTDANGDFAPDCDLTSPLANGECGRMANANFGSAIPGATYDPDVLTGFGHRPYNWEFSVGVQQEVVPRVSVDLGYFRRIWGNFTVTDDRALGANDFDFFSITAPSHAELPGSVAGLRDVKPDLFGVPADNFITLADRFGEQTEHWDGVDLNVNARLQNGLTVMGGFSTGRTSYNDCEIWQAVPEAAGNVPLQYCERQTPFLTQVKAQAVYTIPRIDVQLSGAFQSVPGPEISSLYRVSRAEVQSALGRAIAGGGAFTSAFNLLEPGTKFGERRNQVDLRFGKVLRAGTTRTVVSVDLYNAFNEDTVVALNNNFGPAWLAPTEVMLARFVKFSVQFDF